MQATMTELSRDEKRRIKRDYKETKGGKISPYDRCGLWVLDIISIRRKYALDAYNEAFEYRSYDMHHDRMRWYFQWKRAAVAMVLYFPGYRGTTIPLP